MAVEGQTQNEEAKSHVPAAIQENIHRLEAPNSQAVGGLEVQQPSSKSVALLIQSELTSDPGTILIRVFRIYTSHR